MTLSDCTIPKSREITIGTFTGRLFPVFDPRPEDIDPRDIAHALALKCRWTGHCSHFCSIAKHSLRVAAVARSYGVAEPGRDLFWAYGLLHDAAEAYLADIPSPVKPYIPGWKELEQRVEDVIFERFGLLPLRKDGITQSAIKRADTVLLRLEAQELFTSKHRCWLLPTIKIEADERQAAKICDGWEDAASVVSGATFSWPQVEDKFLEALLAIDPQVKQ